MFEENQIIQNDIIKKFYNIDLIPNLLLIGDNNIEKETYILKFIKKYYKNNEIYINSEILYLNIVIDRSIKRVREIIKKFISEVSNCDENNNIILKFIIIKNIENITFEIQYALRRIIEDNNKKIRFILIGNNSQTIIQPLISRCLLIYFNNESLKIKKKYINTVDDNLLKLYSKNFFLNNIKYFEDINGEFIEKIKENKKLKIKINWSKFFNNKSLLILNNNLNSLIKNNTNYYLILNDFIDWIVLAEENKNISEQNKFKLLKLITFQSTKIVNNGNLFLNLFNIFTFYINLI